MSNIVPTRMELLKKKAQIKLAKKGHALLKKKRDALIMELFKILKEAKDLRKELSKKLKEARKSLYYASLQTPFFEIELIAGLNQAKYSLEVSETNVMGVKIPKITYSSQQISDYPPFLASAQLYNVSRHYREIFDLVIKIAQIETTVKRILHEIEKTKRRVNALEYIIIPGLQEDVKYIKQRLEELERDSFVALKSIKRKLEKESA